MDRRNSVLEGKKDIRAKRKGFQANQSLKDKMLAIDALMEGVNYIDILMLFVYVLLLGVYYHVYNIGSHCMDVG